MKPKEFQTAVLYGDHKMFPLRLNEGYNQVAFGKGCWVDDKMMAAIWVFYGHDLKPIKTIEHPKFYHSITHAGHTEYKRYLTRWGLHRHLKMYHIELGPKESLAKIVKLTNSKKRFDIRSIV